LTPFFNFNHPNESRADLTPKPLFDGIFLRQRKKPVSDNPAYLWGGHPATAGPLQSASQYLSGHPTLFAEEGLVVSSAERSGGGGIKKKILQFQTIITPTLPSPIEGEGAKIWVLDENLPIPA
jgi:hypothetical protein